MSHTPGPWRAVGASVTTVSASNPAKAIQVARAMKTYYATTTAPIKEWEANAKLIAAAPELRATLQNLVENIHASVKELRPHIERAHQLLRSL